MDNNGFTNLKLKEVKKTTATEQVIMSIREALAHKTIKYGDKLPNEAELAAQLGVGRSSLREGIKALSAFGILEARQGEGTFVVNRFAENVFEYLGFTPDTENFKHLIALRRVFEVGCINMVVERITPEQCDELQQLTDQIVTKNSAHNIDNNTKADAEFHAVLLQVAGNPLMTEMYNMISKMLCSMMNQLMCYDDVAYDAKRVHNLIVAALKERDAASAVAAVNEHLTIIEGYLEKYIYHHYS